MTVSLRHILTLVALVLMNSGVGRALHTIAAHGPAGEHGAALAVGVEGRIDALPERDADDCPQCDMLRAGSVATPTAHGAAWTSPAPVAWLTVGDSLARAPDGAGDAQPRGPPAA